MVPVLVHCKLTHDNASSNQTLDHILFTSQLKPNWGPRPKAAEFRCSTMAVGWAWCKNHQNQYWIMTIVHGPVGLTPHRMETLEAVKGHGWHYDISTCGQPIFELLTSARLKPLVQWWNLLALHPFPLGPCLEIIGHHHLVSLTVRYVWFYCCNCKPTDFEMVTLDFKCQTVQHIFLCGSESWKKFHSGRARSMKTRWRQI